MENKWLPSVCMYVCARACLTVHTENSLNLIFLSLGFGHGL